MLRVIKNALTRLESALLLLSLLSLALMSEHASFGPAYEKIVDVLLWVVLSTVAGYLIWINFIKRSSDSSSLHASLIFGPFLVFSTFLFSQFDFPQNLYIAVFGYVAMMAIYLILTKENPATRKVKSEEQDNGRVELTQFNEASFQNSGKYLKTKTLFDLCFTIIVMPIILIVIAIVSLLILICDGRPIFYRQKRVGYRGSIFNTFKFRTMVNQSNCTSENASQKTINDLKSMREVTTADDKRITKLGAFLRRSRLDELPQVVNIFRGEMSWIGPRPEAVALSEVYHESIENYAHRHEVLPGITGWAQVKQGHVTDVNEIRGKLELDLYYIKNVSFWFDLIISIRTIRVMIMGIGAK